jgi:hypothetical protein
MGTPSSAFGATELEVLKAKLSYAWNVWEFHGRQRMNMFNYFLVITGILISGFVAASKETALHGILPVISLLQFVECLVFLIIDWRNRTILYCADDSLLESEKILFALPPCGISGPMSERKKKEKGLFGLAKMVYWIWLTYILVGVISLVALFTSVHSR